MLNKNFFWVGLPLFFLTSEADADINPVGTTITTQLSGTSPIINAGTISRSGAANQYGMFSSSSNVSFTNSGTVTTSGIYGNAIRATGTSATITNTGTLNASNTGGWGIYIAGSINSTVTNSGTITTSGLDGYGIVTNSSDGSTLTNSGYISTSGVRGVGIFATTGNLITIINSGSVVTSGTGDRGAVATTVTNTNLSNSGTISASQTHGVYADSIGSFLTITNTGSITVSSGYYGVYNASSINTINNVQGGNASSVATTALSYSGSLPANYNIIIRSPTYYGQLAISSPSGTTTFGIYSGSVSGIEASTLAKGTYTSVLSGLTSSNLTGATSGNYNGFAWALINSSGTIWDLIVTASASDTQQSLVNTASVLQGTYTLQNTVMVNGFTYDCPMFDKHGVCVSIGGRNTAVQAQGINNTSGLLIASYRLNNNNSRIGAWVDQNLSVSSPSAVKLGNSTPMIGLFGVWSQRPDGVGAEVKVSAAYGQKDTTITRQVVGTSDPGSGGSQLISQGAQVMGKYGFAVMSDAVISPYAGIRYTQNNMGGYTEGTSSTVTAPLTYSALNTNATTVLAGVGASYRVIPAVTTFASAGVETDTNTSNGTYSATNSSIGALTPVNFNANPVRTRPTATLGAYYDIVKNQRIGITGIYRQEAYQAVSTTTVLATYTIGL